MVSDLHRLFHIEKLWGINVFHDPAHIISPCFAVCNEHIFLDEVLPLPSFITQDIVSRHKTLFQRLSLDSRFQEQWEKLEEASKQAKEQLDDHLQWLHMLLDKKRLTLEDLFDPHPQALLVARLIRLVDKKRLSKEKKIPLSLVDLAYEMLSPFQANKNPISYTQKQVLEQKGTLLTERLLHSKTLLKMSLLQFAIEQFEKKSSIENLIKSLLLIVKRKCEDTANELSCKMSSTWPFEDKAGDHFMLLVGNEFLEELEQTLRKSIDDQEDLYGRLFLLRKVANANAPQIDLEKLNQRLLLILHQAMIRKYSLAFLAGFVSLLKKQV
jgi:hypothetical protein